jgi:hypothetical protein
MLDAFTTYAKPSDVALSGFGSTSTSRTIPMALLGSGIGGAMGGYLSSKAGGGHGSYYPGALAGMTLGGGMGGFVGSPAMTRFLIEKAYNNPWVRGSLSRAAEPTLNLWESLRKGD